MCLPLCEFFPPTFSYYCHPIYVQQDAANAILPVYAVTLLFFCGFLIRIESIPPWWKW